MTRAEALARARAEWGDDAQVAVVDGCYRVGYVRHDPPRKITKGSSVRGWREACEAAGLIAPTRGPLTP